MKMEINIEKLENGYLLNINGRKWQCQGEHQISRRIIVELTREHPVLSHDVISRSFWAKVVGKREKKVIEYLNEHPNSTIIQIHDGIGEKWTRQTRKYIIRLMEKKFVGVEKNKYFIIKNPEYYVETGPK